MNFFGGDVCNGDRDDGGGGGAPTAKVRDINSHFGAGHVPLGGFQHKTGHRVFDQCPMRFTCSL